MSLIKDKITVTVGEEKVDVVLRPAPWDADQDALQVPYARKDGHVARSSPMLSRAWAVAVAHAGIERFFSDADVARLAAECMKRLTRTRYSGGAPTVDEAA
jgi:hypothetical protein